MYPSATPWPLCNAARSLHSRLWTRWQPDRVTEPAREGCVSGAVHDSLSGTERVNRTEGGRYTQPRASGHPRSPARGEEPPA